MSKEKKNNKDRRKPGGMLGGGRSMWHIFVIIMLVWIAFTFLQRYMSQDSIKIPYSEFKKEVVDGSVKSVLIEEQEISGEFSGKYVKVSEDDKDTTRYQYFNTIKPAIKDDELINLLEENDVQINAETSGENWWIYILIMGAPWLLLMGYFVYMRKKMQEQMGGGKGGGMFGGKGGMFGVGKSKAKKYSKEEDSGTTFEDVAGLQNAKRDLREIVEYLKDPTKFQKLGAEIPKGVLLMGPPGTGKTLLAKATAGEADVNFFSISGSEFIEMFVGVGASRVRDMFDEARKEAPSVIFIDEIDSVGRARGTGLGGGHDEREQTLNQILNEMDGFEPQESVVVLAATNRPDVLDKALIRPGRFDRQITLNLPQKEARTKILEIHAEDVPLSDDVDLENVAARTVGFSGADLKNLVNEAAMLAGRDKKDKVEAEDFDKARDKIIMGAVREDLVNDEEQELIAYHEAGHALLAKLVEGADPLQKVTIIPRGKSLGATEQIPEFDRHNYRESYLRARITVALGGRVAEKLVYNEFSNGAQNDLKQVTNIARKMVAQWGMSDKLGAVTFKTGEEHLFLGKEMAQQKDFSENTARIIDEEIREIIAESEDKAESILKENRTKLDALADALLEQETLEKDQINWILDKVDGNGDDDKNKDKSNDDENSNDGDKENDDK